MTLIELNREMERKWRAGEITFSQFNWHCFGFAGYDEHHSRRARG